MRYFYQLRSPFECQKGWSIFSSYLTGKCSRAFSFESSDVKRILLLSPVKVTLIHFNSLQDVHILLRCILYDSGRKRL